MAREIGEDIINRFDEKDVRRVLTYSSDPKTAAEVLGRNNMLKLRETSDMWLEDMLKHAWSPVHLKSILKIYRPDYFKDKL